MVVFSIKLTRVQGKQGNLYTCRRPLVIRMPCIPIPAQCGSGPFGGNAIEIRPGVNADHINWLSDTHAGVHCKPIPALLIRSFRGATAYGWLKGNTAVTPLLTHWSYCSLVLSHRFKVNLISMHFIVIISIRCIPIPACCESGPWMGNTI